MAAKATSPLAVFAYDGGELAAHAIEEAGRLLDTGAQALVVTVWQPFEVGFTPVGGEQFDAAEIADVRSAAERTAADGASRATQAGFQASAEAVEGAPAWKALVELAEERGASIIVMGSHGRSGISGALLGSVASSVASHWGRSVLIVHDKG